MTLLVIRNRKVTLEIINIHVISLYVATQNTIAAITISDWSVFIKFSDERETRNIVRWNVLLGYAVAAVQGGCSNRWGHSDLPAKTLLSSCLVQCSSGKHVKSFPPLSEVF